MNPGTLTTITDALDAIMGRVKPAPNDGDEPGPVNRPVFSEPGRRKEKVTSEVHPPLDAGIAPPVHVLPPEPVIDDMTMYQLRGAPKSDLTGPPGRVQTTGQTFTINGVTGQAATLIAPASGIPRRVLLAVVQDPGAAGITLSIASDPRQDNTGFRPTVAHGIITFLTPAPIWAFVTPGSATAAIVSVWIEPAHS